VVEFFEVNEVLFQLVDVFFLDSELFGSIEAIVWFVTALIDAPITSFS